MLWALEGGRNDTVELNAITLRADYGWPRVDGLGLLPGVEAPRRLYSAVSDTGGAAFYRSGAWPSLDGDFFAGTARGLFRVDVAPGRALRIAAEEVLFGRFLESVGDVAVGPDGHLYVVGVRRGIAPAADRGIVGRLAPAR